VVNTPTMSEERFKTLVEAYGGDPARWPVGEGEAGKLWLRSSTTAQALAADAARLDQALSAAREVPVSGALEAKVMADFERAARRWSPRRFAAALADAIWPGAPLWQPACAFGLALAIGVGVAVIASLDLGQSDDNSTATFALDTVPDAGQDI
jgi:hypothetical protein